MPVPSKQALMETPEYENRGDNGFVKSILPVYSMNGLLTLIVSEPIAITPEIENKRIKIKALIFFTTHHVS